LFNESFAATNETEGSEIGRQIVTALLEARVRIFFVSHLYHFANGFYESRRQQTLFLKAERCPDGRRTFKLAQGRPLPTSYGEDLYTSLFPSPADRIHDAEPTMEISHTVERVPS